MLIPTKVLRGYFSLDTSADGSSTKCEVSEYKIEPETTGLKLKPDPKTGKLSLVITEAQLAAKETDVKLVATTLGLHSSKKSLKFVKEAAATFKVPKCVFKAVKHDASFGVKKGSEVIMKDHIKQLSLTSLSTSGDDKECPMNNVKKYTSKANADSDKDGQE